MTPLQAYAQYRRCLDIMISHQEKVVSLSAGTFESPSEVVDCYRHISIKAQFLFWQYPMWEVVVDTDEARERFYKVPIHWEYRPAGLLQVWSLGSNFRIVDEETIEALYLDEKCRNLGWFLVNFPTENECELVLMFYSAIPKGHRREALTDLAQFLGNRTQLQTDWFIPRFRSLGSVKQDTPSEKLRVFFGELSIGLAFLDSPLAEPTEYRLPRPERRRLKKQNQHEPEIRVVTLRRKHYPTGEISSSINWNWKWLVRGHWRNQWYAKSGEHKPVFVEPYVKGPEDKPLKSPRESIYSVSQ